MATHAHVVHESSARSLLARYQSVRQFTERLCEPLATEDYGVQSMPDASPIKWHLAHTSWFFETFVLKRTVPRYRPFHPQYEVLFNSYYNAIGEPFPRARRGLLSRPTAEEIYRYRRHVDMEIAALLEADRADSAVHAVVELGLQHEQQHQELMLTDVKHLFSCNPLRPVYQPAQEAAVSVMPSPEWFDCAGGLVEVGHGGDDFAFDNERPRHRVFLQPFLLARRLVTNGDFLSFMADGGYERPELWLSDGWDMVHTHGWRAPLYWERDGRDWMVFTLAGMRLVDAAEPVCHLSYYEADALARWAEARLPREDEWEVAAATVRVDGNFVESGRYHPAPPVPGTADRAPTQLFGDVWEWTQSPYTAYPGYRVPTGALGEYNAKFMSNQMVLRGGSCASPRAHLRPSYRNFFPPAARWQFMGVRLARDAT